ncbi:MAG TPA: cupin domain-containing protein [Candidatus Acidoferrales bacterium]
MKAVIKRFEAADEVRKFEKGRLELVTVGGTTVGRAVYEPGWKWSEHVGKASGARSCQVEHVVLGVEGRCAVAMDDGSYFEIGPGDLVHVPPGHDSWVVGDQPYVSLHFLGAADYAKGKG